VCKKIQAALLAGSIIVRTENWLTNKCNPNDEERRSVEAMDFDWLRHAK